MTNKISENKDKNWRSGGIQSSIVSNRIAISRKGFKIV